MTSASPAATETRGFKESLREFAKPKMAMMLVLGFTAGLPFLLYFSTLGVWLERSDVDVALIGFFSWFGLSYSLKMFWAPVLDRFSPPGFTKIFGRRRAWILVAQLGVAAAMVGIGISDPTQNLGATALFSFFLAFSSATQDIGIDAWRIEAARDDAEQAPLAAAYQYGYKVGMIISGGVALFIAGVANFNIAYVAMAAIMAMAALVFAIWDRKSGVATAAAAGAALMSVGLFVAFDALRAIFETGSLFDTVFLGVSWIFRIATILSMLAFVFYLVRALMESPEGQEFSFSGVIKGLIFTACVIVGLLTLAAGLGLGISALFTSLGLEIQRSQIALIATCIAATPLVLCAIIIPWVRSLPRSSPHIRNPAYGAFIDFFWRHGWAALLILCLVSFYRLSDIVMGVMAKPAYSAIGYTPEEIGLVSGIYGVWIVFVGVAAAGFSALKFGLKVSLVAGAIVSVLGNVVFAWLAQQSSDSLVPLFLAITADNIAGGYAGTIFIAYMSTLVNKSFAGTQYAIFSSVWSLGPKLLAGASGVLVGQYGYSNFFLIAAALGIPAILLSWFVDYMKPDRDSVLFDDVAQPESAPGQTS